MAVSKPYISTAPASIKRAREASLGVKGCKLFNLLPDAVRNMKGSSVDSFKRELDSFLSTLPDQPTTAGLQRAAESNRLLHKIYMKTDNLICIL